MSRYLKALGLTLVAAFALSAMAASAASADEFTSEKSPIIVTATQELHEGVVDRFNIDAGDFECENIHYAGTVTKTPTTAITVEPSYTGCFTAEIIPVVVDTNGCDFNFTINPVKGKTDGWADLECPEKKDITITVGAPGTVKCTIHVTPQTFGGITYSNIAGGKVTVRAKVEGIKYTETEGTGLGHCTTKSETSNGTYNGAAIVTGYEDLGVHTGPPKVYTEGKEVPISVS